MKKTKKPNKMKLDDKVENVSPPWTAWYHADKKMKFYINSETKQSIWEHPNTLKDGAAGKRGNATRKRREPEKKEQDVSVEDNLMEVDLPPPPKRKTTEISESDERITKRARKSLDEKEPEAPQPAPRLIEPDKILPRVPWNSKIRPLNRLPYRGCAIFDTCALIEYAPALNASIEKQLLTVIPYAVHSELDGLKNNPKTYKVAGDVTTRLKELLQEKNSYLLVETSTEQKIQIEKFRPDETVQDDIILNCALRVKEEMMSIAPMFNINDRAILLVTNDKNLSNKAMIHGLEIESVATFMEIINGNKRPSQKTSDQKKPSTTQKVEAPRALPPVPVKPQENKKLAIESIKKTREVSVWINGMTKKIGDEARRGTPSSSNIVGTPARSRPTIPLEDEVLPTITKVVKPKPTYTPQLSYQSRNIVKPTEPTRPRPQMPCSLSDDEDDNQTVAGDEMDCT